jgi:hypothetical protein
MNCVSPCTTLASYSIPIDEPCVSMVHSQMKFVNEGITKISTCRLYVTTCDCMYGLMVESP